MMHLSLQGLTKETFDAWTNALKKVTTSEELAKLLSEYLNLGATPASWQLALTYQISDHLLLVDTAADFWCEYMLAFPTKTYSGQLLI